MKNFKLIILAIFLFNFPAELKAEPTDHLDLMSTDELIVWYNSIHNQSERHQTLRALRTGMDYVHFLTIVSYLISQLERSSYDLERFSQNLEELVTIGIPSRFLEDLLFRSTQHQEYIREAIVSLQERERIEQIQDRQLLQREGFMQFHAQGVQQIFNEQRFELSNLFQQYRLQQNHLMQRMEVEQAHEEGALQIANESEIEFNNLLELYRQELLDVAQPQSLLGLPVRRGRSER